MKTIWRIIILVVICLCIYYACSNDTSKKSKQENKQESSTRKSNSNSNRSVKPNKDIHFEDVELTMEEEDIEEQSDDNSQMFGDIDFEEEDVEEMDESLSSPDLLNVEDDIEE